MEWDGGGLNHTERGNYGIMRKEIGAKKHQASTQREAIVA